jgi:HAD superfamily phosphatase (TIGR01668 family)
VPGAVLEWVKRVRAAGFQTALVTNNRSRRVRTLAAAMDIPVAQGRFKPSRSMLRRAMAIMGTTAEETALLGDQLLTDIFAGNRLGLYTILVTPIAVREFPATRLVRMLERFLIRRLQIPPAQRREV